MDSSGRTTQRQHDFGGGAGHRLGGTLRVWGCEESETAKSTPQRRRVERRQELLLVIEEENEKPVPKIQWNGSPS